MMDGTIHEPDFTRNPYALSSFMLGVGSLVSCCVHPFCSLPFALAGVGLGIYALNSQRRLLAALGISLCLLSIVLSLLMVIFGVAADVFSQV